MNTMTQITQALTGMLVLFLVTAGAVAGELNVDMDSQLTLTGHQQDSLPARSIYHLQSSWQDQDGKPVKLAGFRGRPVVLTMFFSHCKYACPLLVEDMKSIESKLTIREAEDVMFVLVSFDVERDTPEALKSYAAEKKIDVGRWRLLHSDADSVRELAAVLGVRYRRETDGSFSHSNIISILSPDGAIVHQQEGLGADSTLTVRALQKLADDL